LVTERKSSLKKLVPKISLVVCLRNERDLLERLLEKASGCFDDLVVVLDGPQNFRADTNNLCPHAWTTRDTPNSPESLSLRQAGAPPRELCHDYALLKNHTRLPEGYRLGTSANKSGDIFELVERYRGRLFEGPLCFQQEPHWPFAWWAARHDWLLKLDADEFPSKQMADWLRDFRLQPEDSPNCSSYTCIWPLWDGQKSTTTRWPDGRLFLFASLVWPK
jgi:hypothetical protein